MNFSVIICTHNRARRLAKTLHALQPQRAGDHSWEIRVVADSCSDETTSVVSQFASKAVPLHLHEVRFGSAALARTFGAENSLGRMLLYLDDDAEPMPGWLEAYTRFFQTHPELQAGGGPILIDWSDTPKPAWWQPQFDVNLAGLVLPATLETFPAGEFPFGPNMYFSAAAFRDVGPFNPDLGPRGKVNHVGEETEWFMRYAARGGRIGYVSGALVHHWADPSKATKRSLLLRSFRAGKAVANLPGQTLSRGWLAWLRHAGSATLKGRLTFPEQIYLANWLGELRGRSGR